MTDSADAALERERALLLVPPGGSGASVRPTMAEWRKAKYAARAHTFATLLQGGFTVEEVAALYFVRPATVTRCVQADRTTAPE